MPHRPARPITPDGRYFVVDGQLWRLADPRLMPSEREAHVRELMGARRDARAAKGDPAARAAAHARVEVVKRALGERGPPWWDDGAPDYNRHMVHSTPYAEWYEAWDRGLAVVVAGDDVTGEPK